MFSPLYWSRVYNNKIYRGGGQKHKMDSYTLINLICLCIVNGFFTFAGILLNSVVIICLWKCAQLRRKTCYFLIQVLSCFDLGAIMVGHPTMILLSFAFSFGDNTALRIGEILEHIYIVCQVSALSAFLTINVDRYLAIATPFFYQASVTKSRLLKFMVVMQVLFLVLPTTRAIRNLNKFAYMLLIAVIAAFLWLVLFINCRMYAIAKNRRQATPGGKRTMPRSKINSTCLLVIACFCISTVPTTVYSGFKLFGSTTIKPRTDEQFFLDKFLDKFIFSCVRRTIFPWRPYTRTSFLVEKLAWPAFKPGSLSRKTCQFLAVHTSK